MRKQPSSSANTENLNDLGFYRIRETIDLVNQCHYKHISLHRKKFLIVHIIFINSTIFLRRLCGKGV